MLSSKKLTIYVKLWLTSETKGNTKFTVSWQEVHIQTIFKAKIAPLITGDKSSSQTYLRFSQHSVIAH